jgi:hypothetical protein
MIVNKKTFLKGSILTLLFFVVLVLIFSPLFKGHNGLEYLDALYNSISKGSAYYIPKVRVETDKLQGNKVTMSIDMGNPDRAEKTMLLLKAGGSSVDLNENILKVSGDLGKLLNNCLDDSELMYNNDGNGITEKYGYNEKQVLYNWWIACGEMDKDLKRQKKFNEAKTVDLLKKKAIETSYNYYKVDPQKISDRLWVVIFSLVFYVIYTLWYGFAIMYLFEGWGLELEDH